MIKRACWGLCYWSQKYIRATIRTLLHRRRKVREGRTSRRRSRPRNQHVNIGPSTRKIEQHARLRRHSGRRSSRRFEKDLFKKKRILVGPALRKRLQDNAEKAYRHELLVVKSYPPVAIGVMPVRGTAQPRIDVARNEMTYRAKLSDSHLMETHALTKRSNVIPGDGP